MFGPADHGFCSALHPWLLAGRPSGAAIRGDGGRAPALAEGLGKWWSWGVNRFQGSRRKLLVGLLISATIGGAVYLACGVRLEEPTVSFVKLLNRDAELVFSNRSSVPLRVIDVRCDQIEPRAAPSNIRAWWVLTATTNNGVVKVVHYGTLIPPRAKKWRGAIMIQQPDPWIARVAFKFGWLRVWNKFHRQPTQVFTEPVTIVPPQREEDVLPPDQA